MSAAHSEIAFNALARSAAAFPKQLSWRRLLTALALLALLAAAVRSQLRAQDTEPLRTALEGYISARVFAEALRRADKNPTRTSFIDSIWCPKK